MKILSFDCAVKNMGIVLVDWDSKWTEKITDVFMSIQFESTNEIIDKLNKIEKLLFEQWDILYAKRADLIPGRNVSQVNAIDRARGLNTILCMIDEEFPIVDLILIEEQPPANFKSREIMDYIVYHYSKKGNMIKLIKPHHKNMNINIVAPHQDYMLKYSNNYTANKKHIEENFIELLRRKNQLDIVKGEKNIKDIGDAMFQIIAYTMRLYKLN